MPHIPRGHRFLLSSLMAVLLAIVSACGQTTATGAVLIHSPTATVAANVTAQPPTATVAANSATATTDPDAPCQPDPYDSYSQQTGYVTGIDVANLPAPPRTKHGIGDSGVSNGVSRGGISGMCSIGTADSINAFYTTQLPALGWTYGTPPAALTTACTSGGLALWSGQHWWNGQTLFTWDIEGPGGAGSTFWGYSDCAQVN